MKRFFRNTITVALSAMMLTATALADISSVTVEGTHVAFDGKTTPDTAYFFAVFKPGYDRSALDDASAKKWTASVGGGVSDSEGAFENEFYLDDSINDGLITGEYTIRLMPYGNYEPVWKSFSYLASGEIPGILKKFNNSGKAEFEALIQNYAAYLDLDTAYELEGIQNSGSVYEKAVKQADAKPYESLADIALAFRQCAFMTKFEEASDAAAKNLLEESAGDLNINMAVYEMLSDTDEIIEALKSDKADSPKAFVEGFDTLVAATAFSTLERGDMEYLLNTYKDYITFPVGYDSLSSTELKDLYKAFETANGKFTDFDDISDFIDDFISDMEEEENKSDKKGGSGGGGGRVSVQTPVITDIPAVNTEPESTKTQAIDEPYFSDLDGVEWAKEAIIYLAGRDAVGGVGGDLFAPERNVSREEFVKMIVNAFDIPKAADVSGFADVEPGSWYEEYVCAAVSAGVVNGESQTIFGTGKYITREDMAVMLARVAAYKQIEFPVKSSREAFTDESDISDYAKESVNLLYQNEIINGVEAALFAPKSHATRAMAAKLVYELTKVVK